MSTVTTFRHIRRKDVEIQGVQRYEKGGETYVYHRRSGIRLPSLDASDPEFIAAFQEAETAFQNARARQDQAIRPQRPKPVEHVIPLTPDAIVMTYRQSIAWLFGARHGQAVYYHVGQIAADRADNSDIDAKSRYFQVLADFEAVSLRQRRLTDHQTYYYAIRTDTPLRNLPQNVLTGTVQPIEYLAVNALLHRAADVSVARCLRDTLIIKEDEAREMRNHMIRRGWLTNGRPPELTRLGLSVVA